MRENLLVSFSGGRTSAYMSHWLLMNKSHEYNLQFVFMNTGVEHPKTLEFINQCDKDWGLNLKWLEAVVHLGERKGSTHKIVSYETASRNGEPFEAVCEKYGIPNRSYNHCTRELKLAPFNSWMKENHPGASRAVGIRVDEFDRMSVNSQRDKIIYPLISMRPTTKTEILSWWSKQPFDLEIPEHYGNCVTCWKKSARKLKTIALEHPEYFDNFRRIENLHGDKGANNNCGKFFRGRMSVDDLIVSSKQEFARFKDTHFYHVDDIANGCSESCEMQFDLFDN